MTLDITARLWVGAMARHRTTAVSVLAGISLGLMAAATSTRGADRGANYGEAMIPPSSPALVGRRPVLEPAIDQPDIQRHRAADVRMLDQLYQEVMQSSACYKPDNPSENRYGCAAPSSSRR